MTQQLEGVSDVYIMKRLGGAPGIVLMIKTLEYISCFNINRKGPLAPQPPSPPGERSKGRLGELRSPQGSFKIFQKRYLLVFVGVAFAA